MDGRECVSYSLSLLAPAFSPSTCGFSDEPVRFIGRTGRVVIALAQLKGPYQMFRRIELLALEGGLKGIKNLVFDRMTTHG